MLNNQALFFSCPRQVDINDLSENEIFSHFLVNKATSFSDPGPHKWTWVIFSLGPIWVLWCVEMTCLLAVQSTNCTVGPWVSSDPTVYCQSTPTCQLIWQLFLHPTSLIGEEHLVVETPVCCQPPYITHRQEFQGPKFTRYCTSSPFLVLVLVSAILLNGPTWTSHI